MYVVRERVLVMDRIPSARPQSHDHHTVPKFWLKKFADSKGFLKKFDVNSDDISGRRVHSRRATVEKDLYVLQTLDETFDVDEQKVHGPIENRAARALAPLWDCSDLSHVWPLADQAREDVAGLLAASVMRTLKYRNHVELAAERYLDRDDRSVAAVDLYRSGVLTGDPDTLARAAKRYGLWNKGEKAPANLHSDYVRSELRNLVRHLFEQRWILMRTPDPSFVISDNPVALIGELSETVAPSVHSVDFLSSRGSVTALSRDLLLMTDWQLPAVLAPLPHHGDMVVPYDPRRVDFMRGLLLRNADTQVFGHPDDSILESVRERFSSSRVDDDVRRVL